MKIPWFLVFVIKILLSVAMVDAAIFPILWVLRFPLPQSYIPVTCYEGFFITVIGILLLFNSLFSTVALANDRYVGFGTFRRGLRFKELKQEQRHSMRVKGILMIIVGLLLLVPFLVVLLRI